MENNHKSKWILIVSLALLTLLIFASALKTYGLAWVSVWDYLISEWTIPMPTVLANPEIKWTQEMENKRLEALKPKEVEKPTPKVEKKQEPIKEVKIDTKIVLSDSVQVVACLNERNMTIHAPKNWNCYLGQGGKWKNILLPPKSHIDHFKKIFWDDYKYRLAIANFEGSFNEEAKNPYAIGYLQTLRTHKVKKDVVSQLTWLKNREVGTTGRICDLRNNAPYGWTTKIDRYTCMARWHFGFHKSDSKHYAHGIMYWKRYRATTEYYLSLDF